MSVLVLGAGTDYALLLVSRYREELHNTVDKHEAMRTALASAGPAIFASAATVIAALLCLMIAKVNGTSGLGPIAAIGIFCAALSGLTLLPALLTIFGRRAFWPFVPHTAETAPGPGGTAGSARERIVDGSGAAAFLKVFFACLLVLVLLPLVLLNWVIRIVLRWPLRKLFGVEFPSLIVGPLDRRVFTPYEIRRHRLEHAADVTHGFWARLGERIDVSPGRIAAGSIVVLLILCAGLATFSTDLTAEDSYRTEVDSTEGQHLLDKSFPSGTTALTDIVIPDQADVTAVKRAVAEVDGVEAVSPRSQKGSPASSSTRSSNPTPTRPRPTASSTRFARPPTRSRLRS